MAPPKRTKTSGTDNKKNPNTADSDTDDLTDDDDDEKETVASPTADDDDNEETTRRMNTTLKRMITASSHDDWALRACAIVRELRNRPENGSDPNVERLAWLANPAVRD